VLSTLPDFQGGLLATAKTKRDGRKRASTDPDDFTRVGCVGGFALWSGTSFSAPVMAGRLACALLGGLPDHGQGLPATEAVERGWKAVAGLTPITP
jgi:hypothetical protein